MILTGLLNLPEFFNMIRHNELAKVEKKMSEEIMKAVGGANTRCVLKYTENVSRAQAHKPCIMRACERTYMCGNGVTSSDMLYN